MTHPIYTRDLLENFSRTQLHELCDAIMIAHRRSKEDCIVGILNAQPQLQASAALHQVEEVDPQIQDYIDQLNDLSYGFEDGKGDFINYAKGHHYYADGDLWLSQEPETKTYITWEIGKTVEQLAHEISSLISQERNNAADVESIDVQQDDYLFHDDQQPTNLPRVGDTHLIGGFLLRCAQINSEYAVVWDVLDEKNVVMGEIRMGWDTFWTHNMSLDTFATPQEAVVDLRQSLEAFVLEDEAVAFEKVADSASGSDAGASGKWEAMVNGVLVRITLEASEYKCNLADTVFTDYESAVKGTLVAVARVQEKRLLERTERANTINVLEQNGNEFVVNNCENGNHYIVRPNHPEVNQRCECGDCHYRGTKCKHQIAVEKFLSSSLESAVALSFDDLLDKPFDELTLGDWEILCEPELELVAA
ncbi:hypothetical protein [uncultured Nostoc sp.]|uniref:hypothetical protein n=1 Tax=uncultured Nostoc sp. TaxID=340711 RepID=UPI0035CA73A4